MCEIDSETKWMDLAFLPKDIGWDSCYMVNINENEFVYAPRTYDSKAMWKYNIHQNEWSEFIKYPENLRLEGHQMVFNQHKQKLYILYREPVDYGKRILKMIVVDVVSHLFEINVVQSDPYVYDLYLTDDDDAPYNYPNAVIDPCLLNMEGTIHVIGGSDNNLHLEWNDFNKSFKKIDQILHADSIQRSRTFYISSRQEVVMVGGSYSSNIRTYSLAARKWKILENIEFPRYAHGAILTNDEKYIITIGGRDPTNGTVMNDIFALKIPQNEDEYILKKSKITSPITKGDFCAKTGGGVNDALLVIGYVRQTTKGFSNLQVPPAEIMDFIINYYTMEMLHWMVECSGKHVAIPVQDIIQSLR